MSERSSTPAHWEDARGFLQKRVAKFGLISAAIAGTMFLFRTLVFLAIGRFDVLGDLSVALHAGVVLFALIPWLVLRRGARSERAIHAVEAAGVIASLWCFALMGLFLPLFARPDLLIALALAYSLVTRAIYVPSTPRRSILLAVASAAPAIALAYLVTREVPHGFLAEARAFAGLEPRDLQIATTGSAILFSAITAALSGGTSHVIYGLRSEVRNARRLGQYTLEEKLGEGGMGIVHRASHAMLRRSTAVKLLPPERSGEAAIARFEREVQLTARLTHPNTVTVFDYGRTAENVFYYAMELIEGLSLSELIEHDGAQPPERVVHILLQIAGALGEAHSIGLIHRDVKPANIMLCERGGIADTVKVLDFGLVKELSSGSVLETRADLITGTPMYMSPEAIAQPEKVSAASDLYSVAAVGYYLLTGQHVFPGANAVEVCSHHLHSKPRHPAEVLGRPVPEGLAELLLACLAKDPRARPAGAAELRAALEKCRGAGAWTDEDARRWWARAGRALLEAKRAERAALGMAA